MDKFEPVLVAIFPNDFQAHIAQGVLESHGIVSFIENEHLGTLLPFGFTSLGAIRLMVDATDFHRAKEIINSMPDVNSN